MNFDKILTVFTSELTKIIYANEEYYQGLKIVVTDEQQNLEDAERNQISIVVSYLPATITYGQNILPFTISAFSEFNNIEKCQRLLFEFAETYHTELSEDKTIKQFFTAPTVVSTFNGIFEGYRALYMLTGTLLISENVNYLDVYYNGEKIDTLKTVWDCSIQLDTQATYGSNNFTESVAKIGTFAFALQMYMTNCDLINKCLYIITKDLSNCPDGIDTIFNFDLQFKNGVKIENGKYKLASVSSEQLINSPPVISLSFTN